MLRFSLAAAAVLLGTSAFAHPAVVAPPMLVAQAHDAAVVTVGDIEVSGAFSRATLPNAPVGGAYLSITNKGAADDRLLSVTTPAAGMAQVHEMKMEGDVMKMNEVPDGLVIPAGQTVALEPGGYHLMLMQLTGPLVEGQSFPLTLTFEKAGAVEVQVEIGSPAAKGAMKHSELVTLGNEDLA